MAKRKYGINEKKIEKYIKEGRGSGEKETYKPWIRIQDISSTGRSNRIKSFKTNREHHFLSDLEAKYFYLLEWEDDVIDIREQYPLLDRNLAMKIANEKNIKFPVDTKTMTPIVLTTDFIVKINTNGKEKFISRTVKYSKDLENKRVIEKLEIEREYWYSVGISDWKIVTELNIPINKVNNIIWMHKNFTLSDLISVEDNLDQIRLIDYADQLIREIRNINNMNTNLLQLTNKLDVLNKAREGTFLGLFKYISINKLIKVDMNIILSNNPKIKNVELR